MWMVHGFFIFVIVLLVVVDVVSVAGVLDLVLDFPGLVLHLRQHRLLLAVLVLVLIRFLSHFSNPNTKTKLIIQYPKILSTLSLSLSYRSVNHQCGDEDLHDHESGAIAPDPFFS